MAAASPAQLSGLAELLLRRPPSLRELVTLVGYADDYAWFAGLVRRLFQGRQAAIVLVDHDRVEPHNLLRQNFYPEDVGRFKSQALADRLAKAYRRPIGYSVYAFREAEADSRPDGG